MFGIEAAQANGLPPDLLIRSEDRGSTGVSLMKMRFHGSAHMIATCRDPRVSFNLRGATARCNWRLAGREWSHVARAGGIYISPPGLDCASDTEASLDILSLSIPAEVFGVAVCETCSTSACLKEIAGGEDPILLKLGREMELEASRLFRGGALYWASLANEVLNHLVFHYLSQKPESVGGVLSKAALGRVNAFIAASLDKAIQLDDLADVAAQSRFHFQRTFTRTLGVTPHRYVMRLRARRAVELIRKGELSLASIAADTGFVDQSHLSRWVRNVYGVKLSELRR